MEAPQTVTKSPKIEIVYPPFTSHEFHCGRNKTFKKRSGLSRSITKNNPVKPKNTNDIPADHNLVVSETSYPKTMARNGIKNAPAAIAFVVT